MITVDFIPLQDEKFHLPEVFSLLNLFARVNRRKDLFPKVNITQNNVMLNSISSY